jgi:hypothetical protein
MVEIGAALCVAPISLMPYFAGELGPSKPSADLLSGAEGDPTSSDPEARRGSAT